MTQQEQNKILAASDIAQMSIESADFQRHTISGHDYTTHPVRAGYALVNSEGTAVAEVCKSPCGEYWLFEETTPPAENEIFNNRAFLNIHENAPGVAPDLIEGALVMFYEGVAA